MNEKLDSSALDQLFRQARTQNDWHVEAFAERDLRAIYDLLKFGPTSANCSPARFIFCTSTEARERLAVCCMTGNGEKIRQAPVTAIIGMDLQFYDRLPELFPHADARSWFAGNPDLIRETAMRNSALQGAWLIMAVRALGFDAGPMSGFDKAAVDKAFWAGTSIETNFICSIGHGTGKKVFERAPRLSFDDACRIA